ncbi:MAG: FHA domain-containing protein, partial [Chloroflexi bacterium]|nr:FHA domain-containing protein [Chloroflexota bacterium]
MDPALTLFILRLASAALLLLFLATIGWLIYKDMRLTAAELAARQRQHGALRVLADGAAPESSETFPLLPVTSIGRAPGNTLVLDDSYASNEHALISLRGNQWWLEDLGSRNGTL